MKKWLVSIALSLCCCTDVLSQTVQIENNSNCRINYVLIAIDAGSSCRGNRYMVGLNVIDPGTTVTVDATTVTWNGPAPTGAIEWAVMSVYMHQPNVCHDYNPVSTPCPWDHMIALGGGAASCGGVTSSCMIMGPNNNCQINFPGCVPGVTQVNGTWTPVGGGNIEVEFL